MSRRSWPDYSERIDRNPAQPHPTGLPALARYRLEEIPPAPRRRVALLAKAKRHTRVTAHLIRGFEQNGHEVLWLHTTKARSRLGPALGDAWLRWRLARFRPELVLSYAKDAPPSVWDAIPAETPKAVFYEDALDEPNPAVLALARRASALFTTARGQIGLFERLGVPRAFFLRTGSDPVDHHPVEPDPAFAADVSFIGRATGTERIALLQQIAKRHVLRVYGAGWDEVLPDAAAGRDVYPEQYRRICASSKLVLGIDPRADVDLYFSNRTWLTLGCGGCLLTRYVPSLEQLFENGRHLAWFGSPEECLERIAFYLPREAERRRIAREGSEYVRTYHTFRHATAELMARVFSERWD